MLIIQQTAFVGLNGGDSLWDPMYMVPIPSIVMDDASGAVNASGFASQWNDRSGNAFHFTQSTVARRPGILTAATGGRSGLTFDGLMTSNGDKMDGAAGTNNILNNVSKAWCAAVVRKRNVDAGSQERGYISGLGSDANWRFGCWIGGIGNLNKPILVIRRVNADSVVQGVGSSTLGTGYNIIVWHHDYSTATGDIWVNGTSAFSGTLGTTGNTAASSGSSPLILCGNAGDTLAADADTTACHVGTGTLDRQKWEGWAAWRYGLVANLPGGHPYKNSPPTT